VHSCRYLALKIDEVSSLDVVAVLIDNLFIQRDSEARLINRKAKGDLFYNFRYVK
jgi:hypothetical protein